MRWFQYKGIPTGGAYHSGCGCQTYEVQPGAPDTGKTPKCSQDCDPGYPIKLAQDLHKCNHSLALEAMACLKLWHSLLLVVSFILLPSCLCFEGGY